MQMLRAPGPGRPGIYANEAVELSNRILVFAKGGKLEDDLQIDLPFPRDPAEEDVAVAKAQVLRKFEELSGADLRDFGTQAELYLALRTWRLLNEPRG